MDDFPQNGARPPQAGPDTDLAAGSAAVATELSEAARPGGKRKQLAGLARRVTLSGAHVAGRGTRVATRGTRRAARRGSAWLAGQVLAMVPRLKVRDHAALRAQFPGQSPDQIASALINGAARAAAATGAAAGAWAVLPAVAAFPAEVAAETLVVVGIEVKLVAELHEAFGVPAQGTKAERMRAYLAAWANRRGVLLIPGGVVFAAGSPLARLLRRRLAARAARSTVSLGPLFTGAVAGAMLNGSATRKLGHEILADLRGDARRGDQPTRG